MGLHLHILHTELAYATLSMNGRNLTVRKPRFGMIWPLEWRFEMPLFTNVRRPLIPERRVDLACDANRLRALRDGWAEDGRLSPPARASVTEDHRVLWKRENVVRVDFP